MLCCGDVHQHAGSTHERRSAEKGVEVSIKAVPSLSLKTISLPLILYCSEPQVKYEQAKLQAQAEPLGKKVAVIDMMDYGMMRKVMSFWKKPSS